MTTKNKIEIWIPGPPIAKRRHRSAIVDGKISTYSDQKDQSRRISILALQQTHGEPLQGALSIKMDFGMPIPKGVSKSKRDAMLCGNIAHTKTPDLDNLEKMVLDCLNKIAWNDDKQIVEIHSRKFYSDEPGTMIEIT
jgi:Holliday junction resolvase RusA-like endonuclease